MKALVIMHCATEGPGTLGDWLAGRGVELATVRLHDGDRLPDPAGLSAVISMGGPMNVYEDDRHPFLRQEAEYLRQVVAEGMPVLGVCLGAQMIARAMSARVTKSPAREVGFGRVELTEAGRAEPLFAGLPAGIDVLQWHEDMFEVPAGARLLAASADCPNQAFRVGNALGLQFHVEADEAMVRDWFGDDGAGMVDQFRGFRPALTSAAEKIYGNFLQLLLSKTSK